MERKSFTRRMRFFTFTCQLDEIDHRALSDFEFFSRTKIANLTLSTIGTVKFLQYEKSWVLGRKS